MSGSFANRLARLRQTADAPRWAAPVIVALGLLAAAFEGTGLYLFIPLVQTLSGTPLAVSGVAGALGRIVLGIDEPQRVRWLVVALCSCIVIKSAVAYSNHWITRYVSNRVAHRLRARVFRQTLSSCIDYGIGNKRTDIVNTIAAHTWSVAAAVSLTYRLMVCTATIAVFTALLLLISVRLALVAGIFLTATVLLVSLASRQAQRLGKQVVEENKAFGLRMWEDIAALRLIRSFAREQHETERFECASDRIRGRMVKMDQLSGLPGPLSEICVAILIGTLILVGSRLGVGMAALAAFLALLYRMQTPVREWLSSKLTLDGLGAAIDDVAEFLDRTREPFLANGHTPFIHLHDALEFREVSFRYAESESLVLDRVSFRIPRGRTTAVVGRSGAGKSTLMDLLFRFRDPVSGTVLVDGIPLPELDIASWRERLAIMSQEVSLFHDTVAANIAYGRIGASDAQVRDAARVAGAHDFIQALPKAYDTVLGDSGLRLSGGQRQRIALARTILRDPDILLLDEATNALDNESERFFQTALRDYARGRTVVVIAHRLSTVEDADQVVVLDGGRVVECGTPRALLAADGPFARLHGQPVSDQTQAASA